MSDAVGGNRPGFTRRFRVTPGEGQSTAALEDDFHCMAVTLHHDGVTVTRVEAHTERAPWTTCLGAPAMLVETFAGKPLADAVRAGDKRANCTHLYDMAVLAATHAHDARALVYDIFAGDDADGRSETEIRRDGRLIHRWTIADDVIVAPEGPAGRRLLSMRDWIETLSGEEREAARILQWASLVAHGRRYDPATRGEATQMPPSCYTFQPERAAVAGRFGKVIDFSRDRRAPLDHFDGAGFSPPRPEANARQD